MLETYHTATLCSEGNQDHLGHWLSTIDFLLVQTSNAVEKFRDLRKENPGCQEYAWLEAAASSALKKCDHYHKLIDGSAAYYAAEVLQPGRKWS